MYIYICIHVVVTSCRTCSGKLTFENFCNTYMILLPCAMGFNTQIEILECKNLYQKKILIRGFLSAC